VRLSAACACFIALGFLYVRALARGYVFGTYGSLAHPWSDIVPNLLIFGLCGASLVLLSAFIRRGSRLQRFSAVLLAALPLWVVVHFLLWWSGR
jgi:hypothetical protein